MTSKDGDPSKSHPDTAPVVPSWLLEAFDLAPMMVTLTAGPDHRLVWRNRMGVEVFGPVEGGRPLREVFPDTNPATLELWDRAWRGESVMLPRRVVGPRDVTGRQRVIRFSLAPVPGPDGRPVGVIQFGADSTVEAEAETEAARSRLLADVSAALAGTGDARQALQALTDALVPEVADLAAVYAYSSVVSEAGQPPPADPVALSTVGGLDRLGPPPPPSRRGRSRWRSTLMTGAAMVVAVDPDTLDQLDPDPALQKWMAEARATSVAVAPLVVAGDLAGGVVLVATRGRPSYDEGDVQFLAEVTGRAGAAITEVRAKDRNRRIAERLQQALLPTRPPQPPALDVAARYVPGGSDSPVGGDWWDVLEVGTRVGLGIGDISGHGIGAAALMGQARVAMRAASQAQLPPAEVLALVDNHLSETIDQEWGDGADLHRFATALYAVVDPDAGAVRVASAGHLPALIRSRTGQVRALGAVPGPPLGLALGGYTETEFPLQPGDVLVAYTDGLVETRLVAVDEGIERLATALSECPADIGVEQLADRLLECMGHLERPGGDDLALLVARFTGPVTSPAAGV